MLSISRKDRCKRCHTERALRMCPRTKKGFCWKCCNETRIDLKCPGDCPYSPRVESDSPFPAFKADNNHEAVHATKNYIDLWVNKANPAFEGQSPKQLADHDKPRALEILSSYQFPGNFPVEYLMQRLGIQPQESPATKHAEDIVTDYLNHVIALEFDQLRAFTLNNSPLADLEQRYRDLVSTITDYKKLKNYSFIHTGMSEDGAQSIVFVELNHKDEFCFILREHESHWYIRQCVAGNPALYFKQNGVFQRLANHLANAEAAQASSEISEAFRSYPDSADLYYYRALYWLLEKKTDKAKVDLFNAIAMDNNFGPPYMHLGILYLNEKNYPEAELWFAALCKLEPQNMDAANNLGIALLAQGKKEEAISIWKSILKQNPNYEMAKKNLELYG
jgi:TolA-binding protein